MSGKGYCSKDLSLEGFTAPDPKVNIAPKCYIMSECRQQEWPCDVLSNTMVRSNNVLKLHTDMYYVPPTLCAITDA